MFHTKIIKNCLIVLSQLIKRRLERRKAMEILSYNELFAIKGGAIKTSILLGIFGVGVFIVGVIDGYLRPLACRK